MAGRCPPLPFRGRRGIVDPKEDERNFRLLLHAIAEALQDYCLSQWPPREQGERPRKAVSWTARLGR